MADQPKDPRSDRGSGSDDRDQPLDHTAPFDPIQDDGDDDAGTDPDRTRPLQDDPDRTAPVEPPAADRTQRIDDADRTTQISPTDRGDRMPPADDRTTRIQQPGDTPRNAIPPHDGAWAGRAGIPQPGGPGEPPDDGPPDYWQPGPPDGGRRWWMPILIGIIALILLGVLAFGIWLILRGDDSTPTPEPSRTTAAATTAPPSTAPPSTSAPSPTATTPAAVPVPPLEGLTVAEAGQRLAAAGLTARLNFVDSDEPSGTVVDSDPAAGTEVAPGSTVTLDVSNGPAPTTPPATTPPTTSPSIPPGP
ncbi:PASTA domain-containing protein [Asanoa sp. WMMD1127]|uniref:PASTA domain-containing protein n=1 Tax=Asanoa sp. WMMD1127 TaxID=3016107 RepID=UPI0024161DC6|nr:PASTA domain-containing protein [Asanoa sp. WMMD1127]MDG4822223.1 PASTA domain-containing protein [Asanoa sp. WMMD1127]